MHRIAGRGRALEPQGPRPPSPAQNWGNSPLGEAPDHFCLLHKRLLCWGTNPCLKALFPLSALQAAVLGGPGHDATAFVRVRKSNLRSGPAPHDFARTLIPYSDASWSLRWLKTRYTSAALRYYYGYRYEWYSSYTGLTVRLQQASVGNGKGAGYVYTHEYMPVVLWTGSMDLMGMAGGSLQQPAAVPANDGKCSQIPVRGGSCSCTFAWPGPGAGKGGCQRNFNAQRALVGRWNEARAA
ncbi:uncharacterized protein TRIVIDRAFT_198177 [Trichoderma virens Gv29-8]|uniref:Uncharacterized protein n=1 Tax=Hypocrea virens (strain Gv29-8 / FGSC 10586) TaxID=413071 RepID=G9MI68_HYPVG|nr:uncharacterized protein TRIVIDRAFT_198177 [Trichoderma virens Gv29-8]EHK25185.1 hypothetical protein TRIVIDRAFT_198177 [Trichoderma virens Gv29-8]UKZ48990.1 hypothetical protein TrVGV298_003228 [Trichoderma virens]